MAKKMIDEIRMGSTAKDIITGFVGVVTGKVSYITGCDQCLLAPKCEDDGKIQDARWFDVDRLVEQDAALVKLVAPKKGTRKPTGCCEIAPCK